MIINRIYEHKKSSVAVACFLPGRAKDLSAPLYIPYIVNVLQILPVSTEAQFYNYVFHS